MKVISSYIHALEGRLRIKIPEVKNAPLKAQEVERHLLLTPGVEEVSANPVTGNVLILYNSDLCQQEDIIAALRGLGYLEESATPGAQTQAPREGDWTSRVFSSVASALVEAALSRLVAALI